jgi:hypothetical protein
VRMQSGTHRQLAVEAPHDRLAREAITRNAVEQPGPAAAARQTQLRARRLRAGRTPSQQTRRDRSGSAPARLPPTIGTRAASVRPMRSSRLSAKERGRLTRNVAIAMARLVGYVEDECHREHERSSANESSHARRPDSSISSRWSAAGARCLLCQVRDSDVRTGRPLLRLAKRERRRRCSM